MKGEEDPYLFLGSKWDQNSFRSCPEQCCASARAGVRAEQQALRVAAHPTWLPPDGAVLLRCYWAAPHGRGSHCNEGERRRGERRAIALQWHHNGGDLELRRATFHVPRSPQLRVAR